MYVPKCCDAYSRWFACAGESVHALMTNLRFHYRICNGCFTVVVVRVIDVHTVVYFTGAMDVYGV